MNFDVNLLKERLCKTLCGEVQIRKTRQGHLQILTDYSLPGESDAAS